MSKSKRFYYIISFLFSLLVIATLAAEAIFYVKISNMQATFSEQKYYNEKLEEKASILASLSENYSTIEDDKEIILETLPTDKDASKLVADLNSIAEKNGLKFTSVESNTTLSTKSENKSNDPLLLQTIKGDYGYEMPLSIKVEGSYKNIVPFIEGIESYQRLINITSIDIAEINDEGISDYIEATIDITAYLKR